ncbi:MAG: response regulator [Deltaproteobacteria bacterium]|nr:response regulator [Deltaproteobacteria bacterium]
MTEQTRVLRDALDSLREPLFIVEDNKGCVFANSALFQFLGIKRPEDSVLDLSEFWPGVTVGSFRGEEIASEFKLKSGDAFAVKLSIQTIHEHTWIVRVLAGVSRSDALHNFHAHRLETLGMLAGGVAHDFNNVLAGILGHITYLKMILPARGTHTESLSAIEDGAKKASTLTQQILSFSKLEGGEKVEEVNVCELARGACKLLRGAISPEYSLECNLPQAPVCVLAVEGKLAQVIVNLVINARDAIGPEGFIRVSVATVDSEKELEAAFGTKELSSKSYARLTVTDNGHGMDEAVLEKIFEPYFSTKKDKGTGLGLAVVREIVQLFGGAILVESKVNVGTTISVYLPIVSAAAQQPRLSKGAPSKPELPRGSERILVIDDEYPVRNVLCVSLEHLGYEVDVAESGKEAIEKYQASQRYDLVLLDMIMPQLSGDQVFVELKKFDPTVRVLVISGFSSETAVRSILNSGGRGFIQKPFTIEELSKNVRSCLA